MTSLPSLNGCADVKMLVNDFVFFVLLTTLNSNKISVNKIKLNSNSTTKSTSHAYNNYLKLNKKFINYHHYCSNDANFN